MSSWTSEQTTVRRDCGIPGPAPHHHPALPGKNERHAADVYRQIRTGTSLATVAEFAQHGNIRQDALQTYGQTTQQDFLKLLCQTTAPLQDIVEVASRGLASGIARINLPSMRL